MKSTMKRFVSALAGLLAVGWTGIALAQATTCPKNFICAFSAAETMSLVTPKPNTPGQPDVYIGYLSFESQTPNPTVTLTGVSDVNGTVTTGINMTGTCADSSMPLQPAIITFPGNGKTQTQISFVKDSNGTELQFILTQDLNSTTSSVANSVRIGVCRQQ